jgi:uncharacterized protein
MNPTKQLLTYIGLLMGVSWAIQILAIIATGDINSDGARIWLAGAMISPLIVTLLFLNRNKELRSKVLWKPNNQIFITSFIAVLVPILIAFIVLFLLQKFNFGHSNWFSFSTTEVSISGGPFLLGKGQQTWHAFIFNILLTGIVFGLLNSFIATGEEYAWRGLLQPILTENYGIAKGIAILGFIWSMWHLPALLAGYNYPENPVLGCFVLFPIRSIATSFFYAWLTMRNKSFIPAAIAHGALNSIQTGILSNIQLSAPNIYENVITIVVTVFFGLLFYYMLIKENENV